MFKTVNPNTTLEKAHWAKSQSPWGNLIFLFKENTLYGLEFEESLKDQLAIWQSHWKIIELTQISLENPLTQNWILTVKGTPLQISVWKALLSIPNGKTTTYSAVATKTPNPKAIRAVATAIGQNPISLLIPCHRVLRKSGSLGGYRWGLDVKQKILSWEQTKAILP